MLNTLSILLPIFGLIAAGFISRKTGVLGPTAASELNRYVVWLALPALLFDIMAHSHWQALFLPAFINVYLLGTGIIFLLILVWRLSQGKHLADASVDGVAAAYSNTGYVGFPLLFLVFGASSQIPTTIASIIVVCILFSIAIMLIETGLQAEKALHLRIKSVLSAVFRNPLVVSPIAGVIVAASGLTIPDSVETFLHLLSDSASPCALVSLGLFLASSRSAMPNNSDNEKRVAWVLTFTKLAIQPLLVAVLAFWVFDMDKTLAMMAVLLAALPTGTGPFMLAEFYQRDAYITAQTIMFSTVISLLTLTVLLNML